ncbi:hypothetical protein D9Q98_003581 [Chlorella vulgaris]|uniref:F-box protein n=1 Tax=Chlorella vulgaris TaxID=3077 RepID=A0A9D4TSW7_CHLVU|nr:hypothetical protein D9Q98_003581 [Chlorella vulgaris]
MSPRQYSVDTKCLPSSCMDHPYGVQPALGLFAVGSDESRSVRSTGLGSLAVLPDEAVLGILESLPAADLARLSVVSRFLHVFCHHDDLWKGLCLEELEGRWDYQGSWQETYLSCAVPGYRPGRRKPLRVAGVQSDLLYTPWLCASMAIDAAWLEVDNIERRAGLSLADFREQFELPNKPVILTDVVTKWPAMEKWSRQYLEAAFEGSHVLVGDQPISFQAYCKYADTNRDELPLYLFDKTFCSTAPQLADDYSVPELFRDDLFSLLGADRPDWRWLIIGPVKSGSSWHKDPNSTSAWNGVVRGSKKWVLYPPHITPPGVRPSEDGADVASPVSLMEWFTQFYPHKHSVGCAPAECVLRQGEMLFVPRNWWHVALNLEEAVAVTQNYVSPANLPHVLRHLRSRSPALVSGCAAEARSGLYDTFTAALRRQRPELLQAVEAAEAAAQRKAEEQHKLAELFREPAAASGSDRAAATSAAGLGSKVEGRRNGCTAAAVPTAGASSSGAPANAVGFSFGFQL